jgi:hypothetical protein
MLASIRLSDGHPVTSRSPGRLEAAGQEARFAGSGPTGREESTASFAGESQSFLSFCGNFFARALTKFSVARRNERVSLRRARN